MLTEEAVELLPCPPPPPLEVAEEEPPSSSYSFPVVESYCTFCTLPTGFSDGNSAAKRTAGGSIQWRGHLAGVR